MEPSAWCLKNSWDTPVPRKAKAKVRTSATTTRTIERRMWTSIKGSPSVGVQRDEDQVDELDEDERDDDAAHAVDPHVPPQDGGRARGTELDAPQCQRDQRHDDERVEDDGREHGTLWAMQLHDVQRVELRVGGDEQGRATGEVLSHVVGDGEGGQRAPGDEQLLADLHHVDELGGVGVEVDHV